MNAAAALADRNHEIRLAARDWRAAGLVDDAVVAAADARYPDDRVRIGVAMRVLLFVLTYIAGSAAVGFFGFVGRHWSILLMMGLVFAALTELQIVRLRRAGGGTEEATSLLAVGLTAAGILWGLNQAFLPPGGVDVQIDAVVALAVAATAAWRWLMPAYGAIVPLALFVFVLQLPAPRSVWLVAAVAICVALELMRGRHALVPSHRNAAAWALVVAVVLLYLAANLWGFDERLIEEFAHGRPGADPLMPRALAGFLTVALPAFGLVLGVRRRDRLWLWLGAAMLAASAVTLRHYVHIAPLWALLLACGAILAALALAVQRWLATGPARERTGFTAEPLFEGRLEKTAEMVTVLASLAPAARPLPAESGAAPGEMKPGGGEFGGGGASESF